MISIVIPMYNSQNCIESCIQSIIKQTYSDLEIIVVDDGSTDNGKDIVNKLAKQDDRIKYRYKNNGGVSSARNYGIDCAQGEYLCFVDSDDIIIPEYLQALYEATENTKSDICMCGYLEIFPNQSIERILPESDMKKLTGRIYDDLWILRKFINSPCLKLYRLQTVNDNHIRFNENMVTAEDQDFNYRYFAFTETVSYVNTAGYYYYRNDDSLSRSRTRRCFDNDFYNHRNKSKFLRNNNIYNGNLIIAESTCYLARRYSILSDEKVSYSSTKKRLVESDLLKKPVKLPDRKDHIIYALIHKHLYFLIYIYMRFRLGS